MSEYPNSHVLYRLYDHANERYEGEPFFQLTTLPSLIYTVAAQLSTTCSPTGEWCPSSASTLEGLASRVVKDNVPIGSGKDIITIEHGVRLILCEDPPAYQDIKPVAQEELQRFIQLCRQERESPNARVK